ncbi:hypothetical protein C0585_06710 [Candidatus Woesearchaeota archaeon]|nr:MAG: hypothetical protein C0585_06710 [Candidatus Woesearchaeota archaeon]
MFDIQSKTVKKIENGLKDSFSKIREEMDIHLDTINENTNELAANYDYMMKLEGKIDKLNERIDELTIMMEEFVGMPKKIGYKEQFENIVLSNREQEVFLVLYSSQTDLSHNEIARKLGLTIQLVDQNIDGMISKGVPIIKRYNEGKVTLKVDDDFKSLQAKENILNINEAIVTSIMQ